MKLNHRDRVLITIVFVVAVWIIGVWVFIIPAFQELGEKRDELNSRQVVLSEKKDQIEKDKDLPQRIEQAYARSEELAKAFYTRETTQAATDVVDDLLDVQNIVNSNMEITEYATKTIKPFYYVSKLKSTDFDNKVEEYEKVGASSSKSDKTSSSKATSIPLTDKNGAQVIVDPNAGINIGFHEIEFNFKGVYKDVQKFCEELTKNVKCSMVLSGLIIKDVNGIEEEEKKEGEDSSSSSQVEPEKKDDKEKGEEEGVDENEVEGTITIDLMVIQKLTKPEF